MENDDAEEAHRDVEDDQGEWAQHAWDGQEARQVPHHEVVAVAAGGRKRNTVGSLPRRGSGAHIKDEYCLMDAREARARENYTNSGRVHWERVRRPHRMDILVEAERSLLIIHL